MFGCALVNMSMWRERGRRDTAELLAGVFGCEVFSAGYRHIPPETVEEQFVFTSGEL